MRTRRVILCALPVLGLLAYCAFRGAERHNDFKYPYNVARHAWKKRELAVAAQPRYPVTFHVLLAPLASRPIREAALVWAVLSFAAVGALPGVLARLSGVPVRKQWPAWLVVAPCVIDALVLGQSDPLNLLLVAAGLLAVKEGRALTGTGLVGCAAMVKFLPIVFWATIWGQRRSCRVPLGIALTTLLGFGLVAVAVGPRAAIDGFAEQYRLLRDHEKPWHLTARRTDLRPNNESLPIVLARTFGDLGPDLRLPSPSLSRLPLRVVWSMWGAILAALAGGWLLALRGARRLPPERAWLGSFAVTAVVMLAATPICWFHYFLWALPAALFLSDRRGLLIALAMLFWLGAASQWARGMGCHIVLALGLFALVARELHRGASSAPVEVVASAGDHTEIAVA